MEVRMKRKVYMIYIGYIAVMVVCSGILLSCNQETILDSNCQASDIPVPVRIFSLGTDRVVSSRVPQELPTDKEVGFFMGASSGYTAANNHQGKYQNGSWSPNDQLWLSSLTATLAVYYPYTASLASTISMAPALRTDASKDLCSAKFTADNKTTLNEITMDQRYSRLLVKVVKSEDYMSPGTWTLMTLEGDDIYDTGTFDPINETYAGTKGTFSTGIFSPNKKLGTDPTASDVASADVLIIPNVSMTGPVTITLTVDKRILKAEIPADKLSGGKFTPGKVQTIVLKVSPLGLKVNKVSTTDWADVIGGNVIVDVDNPPTP